MTDFSTPAGIFRILLNGVPTEFEAQMHSPYTYHDIPITACYEVHLSSTDLHKGDVIRIQIERGDLVCDGGGEYRLNLVGQIGAYTMGIGVPDTQELAIGYTDHRLPYELLSFDHRGFFFEIKDNPKKHVLHPLQKGIFIVVAWESNTKEYA